VTREQFPFACLALIAMLGIPGVLDSSSKVMAKNAAQPWESLINLLPALPSVLPRRLYRPL
jgi:hypothetical protein